MIETSTFEVVDYLEHFIVANIELKYDDLLDHKQPKDLRTEDSNPFYWISVNIQNSKLCIWPIISKDL